LKIIKVGKIEIEIFVILRL